MRALISIGDELLIGKNPLTPMLLGLGKFVGDRFCIHVVWKPSAMNVNK
jgi:hypothetical protein